MFIHFLESLHLTLIGRKRQNEGKQLRAVL